jgi:hypothetical protein
MAGDAVQHMEQTAGRCPHDAEVENPIETIICMIRCDVRCSAWQAAW